MAQLLPDTGKVQFLATQADTRPEKAGTVYGSGHITDYDATDKEFILQCYLDGKIALIESHDPPPPDPDPEVKQGE